MRLIDADALMNCGALRGERYDKLMLFEITDAIDAAPTISPADNWIPCAEGLPKKKNTWVFATVKYDEEHIFVEKMMFHNKNCETWCDSRGNQIRNDKILAWQPLPTPWTEEKKGEADGK